jgi:hypothetical protein
VEDLLARYVMPEPIQDYACAKCSLLETARMVEKKIAKELKNETITKSASVRKSKGKQLKLKEESLPALDLDIDQKIESLRNDLEILLYASNYDVDMKLVINSLIAAYVLILFYVSPHIFRR